jgi:hypothetical protein
MESRPEFVEPVDGHRLAWPELAQPDRPVRVAQEDHRHDDFAPDVFREERDGTGEEFVTGPPATRQVHPVDAARLDKCTRIGGPGRFVNEAE